MQTARLENTDQRKATAEVGKASATVAKRPQYRVHRHPGKSKGPRRIIDPRDVKEVNKQSPQNQMLGRRASVQYLEASRNANTSQKVIVRRQSEPNLPITINNLSQAERLILAEYRLKQTTSQQKQNDNATTTTNAKNKSLKNLHNPSKKRSSVSVSIGANLPDVEEVDESTSIL